MPRPRKPAVLQQGHLTKEIREQKEKEEELATAGREQLARAPTWLSGASARKEFERIVQQLEDVTVIGNLDLNNLAGYCNAYAFYRDATKALKKQPLIVEKPLPNGASTFVENPLIRVQKNFAEEMRRFAALCGLTIDSRLKMATAKLTKENETLKNEFGDI